MRSYLLVPLLVAAAAGIALLDDDDGWRAWVALRADLEGTRERIVSLERGVRRLQRKIEALSEDEFAQERAIREELGLARPGEVLVLFEHPSDH